MADERIRQVEREYRSDPTHENLSRLLNTYRRYGIFVNLVDLEISFNLNDIYAEPPRVYINNDEADPVFGPWGLDDFKNTAQTRNILNEVFQDAGLVFDPDRLDQDLFRISGLLERYIYDATNYEEARNIVDKLYALGLPPKSVWADKWVGVSEALGTFIDDNDIPFSQTQWRYSPEEGEEFYSPEGATEYEYLQDIAKFADFPKELAWSITEQRNLLAHPDSPGLLHLNGPIPEVVENRILAQQDMVTNLFGEGHLKLYQAGYLPETFRLPEDDRQIMVALWRAAYRTNVYFIGSIHILNAENQHFVDEIAAGIQMRGELYTQTIAAEELKTTLERNDIWDEIVWIPDVHWQEALEQPD